MVNNNRDDMDNMENEVISDASKDSQILSDGTTDKTGTQFNKDNQSFSDGTGGIADDADTQFREGSTNSGGSVEDADVNADIEKSGEQAQSYTSEYGNTVSGRHTSSLYSYSYKDNRNSATSSGDYHAGGMSSQGSDNQNGAYQSGNGVYGNSTGGQQVNSSNGQFENNNASPYGNGYNNSYNDNSYNNNGYNDNSYNNNGYNNNSYNDNGYNNNSYNDNDNGMQKNNKQPLSFGKKLAVCVVLAVVFGIVGGIFFQGVDLIAAMNRTKVEKDDTDKVKIGGQADAVGTASVATGSAVGGMIDVSGIVEQAMPAIVSITSTYEGVPYTDLFGRYYQNQESTSCGSGFIVGKNKTELLIATNNHVINGAKTISVQFIDDEVCEASVKGTDSSNDLAVIAVKLKSIKEPTMEKVKIADLGNSDDLKVGEMAIAIGNALGYGQSVTVGYISAKDREIEEKSETDGTVNKIKAIQTDAAINPGNSGGALMNISGQVIGINSAKIAASVVEGVGYAIPISQAIPIIDNLKTKEKLSDDEKGYLGVKVRTVSDELSAYNMPNGVYVAEISEGGAAAKGGILVGDIITSIENMEVRTKQSLVEKVTGYRKGTKIKVTLQRSNNGVYEEKNVTVTLQGVSSLNGLSDDDSSSNNNNYYGNGGNGNNDYGSGNYGNDGNGSGNDGYDGNGSWFDEFPNPFGY